MRSVYRTAGTACGIVAHIGVARLRRTQRRRFGLVFKAEAAMAQCGEDWCAIRRRVGERTERRVEAICAPRF